MKLTELARKSREAAEVRAYQTHPDVIALRIERVRAWSAGLIWAGVVLGLAFTMTNVQQFAANGAQPGSLSWLSAWLLDPMVSLVLVGVLLAEQVTARWELDTPVWARNTKWFALAATYVMNTWQPWEHLDAPGIVLHSVPPLLVFAAVEGGPAMREALTKAVARSLATSPSVAVSVPVTAPVNTASAVHDPARSGVQEAAHGPVHDLPPETAHELAPAPVREPRPRRSVNARKTTRTKGKRGGGRMLFADYLTIAREHLADEQPSAVTPAWCRAVTGCSAGTSVKLAAALSAEPPASAETTEITPDVDAVPAEVDATDDTTDPVELEGEAA
jgi:hypothetical protein